ncbi:MAG: preprotein translocase subunit SecE [Cytophagales bacterium]|nr:preprotein translocase subunit SecE [Cytophagales bacterium]
MLRRLMTYFVESYTEVVHRVTWPSYSSLQASATLVLISSLLLAVVVGGMDAVIERALRWLYSSF